MKLKLLTIPLIFAVLSACRQPGETTAEKNSMADYEGTFVSDGYQERSRGYDWVGVSISALSDSTAHVAVRSRVDQKKATCTFDSDKILEY